GGAHDFNHLLSVIMASCELASLELPDGDPAGLELSNIQAAAERAAALTAQLLAFSRKQILQPQVLDINEVLGELQPMLERLLDDNIEVRVFPADGAHNIRADHGQIQQVLLNLVVNARDAMPEGGVLTLEARSELVEDEDAAARLDLDVGAYVILTVSDTGVGMDAETRERIFEPFFTTKGPGSGTGLGLATVFGIVRQSGGSIWVYSEEGFGTTFKIYFPATDSPAESRPPRSSLPPGPVSGTILLVEDEEHLRAVVERVLARAGYDVLAASSPQQALEIAEHHDGGIDLLLTDVLMPGMTGRQVADGVQQHRPKTVVLFMSGYTENSIVHHGVLDTGVNFIPKPLTPARLLEAIGEALGGRADAG
ncbi:MAG: ATP-binding protein, partial [Myxococcales bacterium]|nr:ATP-binding protein [Myxococcales bacterium]